MDAPSAMPAALIAQTVSLRISVLTLKKPPYHDNTVLERVQGLGPTLTLWSLT